VFEWLLQSTKQKHYAWPETKKIIICCILVFAVIVAVLQLAVNCFARKSEPSKSSERTEMTRPSYIINPNIINMLGLDSRTNWQSNGMDNQKVIACLVFTALRLEKISYLQLL
jgi:hypothetical protein